MGYFDRFKEGKYANKSTWQKVWFFIWTEDSLESWIVNIILAYVLIKFLLYPGLGLILGTTHPIVAVVSGSMQHNGQNFDSYWEKAGAWYEAKGITKGQFDAFTMHNGFNKGDIMILVGAKNADVGDIIVFQARRPDPIIHRVVKKDLLVTGDYRYQTKGDNYLTNPESINAPSLNELDIRQEQLIGKAFIRVPFLGYVKIWAVDFVCLFGKFNFCIGA